MLDLPSKKSHRERAARQMLPFFKSFVVLEKTSNKNDEKALTRCIVSMMTVLRAEAATIESSTSSSCAPFVECTNYHAPSLDNVLQLAEIALQVYSYLPLRDRLFTLALVNKQLNRNAVRSGFRRSTYTSKDLSLVEVLGYHLQHKLDLCKLNPSLIPFLLATYGRIFVRVGRTDLAQRIRELQTRNATLSDIQNVMYKKRGILVDVSDAAMKTYLKNGMKSSSMIGSSEHWMDEMVYGRKLVNDFLFGKEFNQFSQLMDGEDVITKLFLDGIQKTTCLSRKDDSLSSFPINPRFTVVVQNFEYGWNEHKVVACDRCGRLHLQNFQTQRECKVHRGHGESLCSSCLQFIMSPLPPHYQDANVPLGCAVRQLSRTNAQMRLPVAECIDCNFERLRQMFLGRSNHIQTLSLLWESEICGHHIVLWEKPSSN